MEVRCPSCQAMLALADSAAGKRALCPSCEAEFRVPAAGQAPHGEPTLDRATSPDSLVRCPACDRTLAYAPAMAGQTIICPTCQRRLRMPTVGGQVTDLGTASTFEPAGNWNPPGRQSTPAPPPNFERNPYSPVSKMPSGAGAPPDRRPNYILPGIFLTAFSGPALFLVGLYLMALMLGNVVAGPVETLIVLILFTLAALSHAATFIGGMQMIRQRSLRLAKLGAWAALYPCGICGFLQMPFAIWALVILYRDSTPEDFVSPENLTSSKDLFSANPRSPPSLP